MKAETQHHATTFLFVVYSKAVRTVQREMQTLSENILYQHSTSALYTGKKKSFSLKYGKFAPQKVASL